MARRRSSSVRTARSRRSGVTGGPAGGTWLIALLLLGIAGAGWFFRAPLLNVFAPPPPVPTPVAPVSPGPAPAPASPSREEVPPALTFTPPPPIPVPDATGYPRVVSNLLEAQIALARRNISSGSIDGVPGAQTAAALVAFQTSSGLPPTGQLDPATRARLFLASPAFLSHVVTAEDLEGLLPIAPTWAGKSEQPALAHETLLERLAERTQAHPNLLRRLNPAIDWDAVAPGTALNLPAVERAVPDAVVAHLHVRLAEHILQARDAQGGLIAHFPVSIAKKVDKRPVGELRITVIAPDPNYTFDPAVFPESPEAQQLGRKLILPPGPNNPVGVAWIGLDRAGYGIHGTPTPEQVGRTESHGCFRLANWDARALLTLVRTGLPVYVEP